MPTTAAESRRRHRRVVGSASTTFLAFAAPVSMFGVLWPDARADFDQSLGALGVVSLVYGLARMATSGAGRRTTARFGIGPCFVVALAALAVADLALAAAPNWPVFLVGVGAIGVVSGLLDSVGAGVVATLGDIGDAGLIHGAYGVGATIGPLVVAVLPGWRWSLVVAAAAAVVALAVARRVGDRWPTPPGTDDGDRAVASSAEPDADSADATDVADEREAERAVVLAPETSSAGRRIVPEGERGAGRPPTVPTAVSLAVFFAFVACEVTLGNWLFAYLTEARSIGDGVAAVGVSGFWAGTTVGRLSLVSGRVRSLLDRAGTVATALVALCLLLVVPVAPGASVVVVTTLVGLALGPLVPTLSARTSGRVGARHAQQVSGWQLLAANVGAISVPFLTGRAVDSIGPGVVVPITLGVFAVGIPSLVAAARLSPA